MRRIGWLIAVAACSPAPAERLRDPKPAACKSQDDIAKLEAPIYAANVPRDDAARAKFLADRQLTLDGGTLPMMLAGRPQWSAGAKDQLPDPDAVQRAVDEAHHRDRELIRLDLGRATWSQVVVERATADEQPCVRDPLPAPTWQLAHDPTGTTVVLRTRTSRKIVSSVEQCGTCYVGCGIPTNGFEWIAVVLPVAAGVPYRIEKLDLVDDHVEVRCEREANAM